MALAWATCASTRCASLTPSRPKKQVLNEVSLHCPPGETTALVGFSGSGKSSLLGLLLGFYDLKVWVDVDSKACLGQEGQGSVRLDDAPCLEAKRI